MKGGIEGLSGLRVLDAVGDPVAVLDAERRFVSVNPAMTGFLGVPAESIIGRPCRDILQGIIGSAAERPFFRIAASMTRESIETEIPGKGIWIKVSVDPIRDPFGRLAGTVCIITDITDAKRNETRAGEDSARLLSLMNNIPGVVYRGLPDWSLSLIGAEVRRLTGFSAGDFLSGSVSWLQVIHPDDLDRVRRTFRRAIVERRSVLRAEYRILHGDGDIRWVADRRQLFYDDEGRFAYVDGLLLDISERKASDARLRATTDKFQTLVDASPLPIMALTLEGTVTLWNKAAERVFGWRSDEVFGMDNPIVPEEKRDELGALRERVLREGGFSGVEVRRRRKDGTLRDFMLSTAPLRDESGAIAGIMSIMADITDRKRMEEALRDSEEQFRQAQKMEAVGRLAGGVAHDFNNLLTAIRGYADLLLMGGDEVFPVRREVEEIQRAADRAADLTQQLLAFSRKQVLQPKVLDLNAVVSNMDKMLRRLIGEDVDLITVLRPGLGTVKVDPGQIEQVIMNLAVNARDAMPEGGRITIETANVDLSAEYASFHAAVQPGPHVMMTVTDTGTGMDDATKQRLFEPFFTTKELGKGTGLGLSTVYGIVKQSSGSIWVYSEPGKGTCFKVYLPRDEEPDALRRSARRPGCGPRGKETLLLVEDEPVVRMLAAEIMRKSGYHVLEAGNGGEALRLIGGRKNFIDLMVTDVVMPGIGGRELVEQLPPFLAGMKILYMSGYPDDAVGRHGFLDPETPFLQKPFTADGLLRKIREVLDA